jgi:hypothetical protein
MEAKVDIRKLQLLNDRIHQTIDALNQVRMSVQGIQHSAPQYPSASGSFSPNAAQQLAQQQVQLLVQLALANPAAASQAIAQNPYLQQMLAQTPWAQQALASTGFGNGSFGFGAGIAHSNGYGPAFGTATPWAQTAWGGPQNWQQPWSPTASNGSPFTGTGPQGSSVASAWTNPTWPQQQSLGQTGFSHTSGDWNDWTRTTPTWDTRTAQWPWTAWSTGAFTTPTWTGWPTL